MTYLDHLIIDCYKYFNDTTSLPILPQNRVRETHVILISINISCKTISPKNRIFYLAISIIR